MYYILGKINVSKDRASIDFCEDFTRLYLWFIKKEYPALSRELSRPRYGTHITLFKGRDHSVSNLSFLESLNKQEIEVEIDPKNLIHSHSRRGADMFILQIYCPKVLDIIDKAGIQYNFGENKIHLTICSNKSWRIARGL